MPTFYLKDVDAESIKQILQEVRQRYSQICGLTGFIANQTVESVQKFVNEKTLLMNQLVFLLAKHLQPDLTQTDETYRTSFITVARNDGSFGLDQPLQSDPLSGGFSGLVKSLALEWPAVLCRAVDFDTRMDEDLMVQKLVLELLDPNMELREVAYKGNQRLGLVAENELQGAP
jgi:hypothetical protein